MGSAWLATTTTTTVSASTTAWEGGSHRFGPVDLTSDQTRSHTDTTVAATNDGTSERV